MFLHDYTALEYADSIGQTDRNVRGVRETTLKKLRRLYGGVLADRRENRLPMTLDERYFPENGVRKKGKSGEHIIFPKNGVAYEDRI